MNEELTFKVKETLDKTEVFNGYTYKAINIEVDSGIFIALIPIDTNVEIDKKYTTMKWTITHVGKNTKPATMCARIDELEEADGKKISPYLNSKLTFKVYISESSAVKYIGPDRKKFFNAVARMIDYNDKAYKLPIYAFGKNATEMSQIKNESTLTAVVTLRHNTSGDKYELSLVSIQSVYEKN